MAFDNLLNDFTAAMTRLDNGKFIRIDSTVDEPYYLNIKSNVRQTGNSDYLVQFQQYKNTASGDDSLLQCHMVIKADLKNFTQAEIQTMLGDLFIFAGPTYLTKLLRGER